jgi:hypothetical protein
MVVVMLVVQPGGMAGGLRIFHCGAPLARLPTNGRGL